MIFCNYKLFVLFAKHGVLSREQAKNHPDELRFLSTGGYVQKVRQGRRVYFALTRKALPLLEDYRCQLLYAARLNRKLHPRSNFYASLLEDLRFFDSRQKEAQNFLLLSDWQLNRPVSAFQLELAQQRYFSEGAPTR